jgi:hypothetical protein
MSKSFLAFPVLLTWFALGVFATNARAAVYNYSGVVTVCTGTCDAFPSLAVGSLITGPSTIDVGPNDSFTDADITDFTYEVFNPALPVSGPVGDPTTDNPMIIGSGVHAVSNGSNGTTDGAGELNGGEILLEFIVPPFNDNGAFVESDLVSGESRICLFYATAGCIEGATESAIYVGTFTLYNPPELIYEDGFEDPEAP